MQAYTVCIQAMLKPYTGCIYGYHLVLRRQLANHRDDASAYIDEIGVFSLSADCAREVFELLIRMLIEIGVRLSYECIQ